MNIAKERTQIDVGGRDKTLAALSSQAECFEMDETDDGRTADEQVFSWGQISLSLSSFGHFPSSARPCFPFSESDSPSPPILLPRFLLAICSGHILRQCEEERGRESERWVGRRGGGGKVGETKTTTPRERENQRSDRHPTPFPTATRKGLLRSGGLDLDPPLHKWLGGVFALKLGIKTVPNRK